MYASAGEGRLGGGLKCNAIGPASAAVHVGGVTLCSLETRGREPLCG
jgi:hypothetical protein